MPGQLRKRFRLHTFYQRLVLLGVFLLVLIWGSVLFSLNEEKHVVDENANQSMLMVFRGSETRANDVFYDAYEYARLAQVADRSGLDFGVLYSAMVTQKYPGEVINGVILFDRAGRLFYSSSSLPALPDVLRQTAPNDEWQYIPATRSGDARTSFYIVGTNPSGTLVAIDIDADAFASYVRPAVFAELFQLSLSDRHNRFFSSQNVDEAYLEGLSVLQRVNDSGILREQDRNGVSLITCQGMLQAAPVFLRIALPESVLTHYYARRDQTVLLSAGGSLILLLLLFFVGRIAKVRIEATRQLEEEKERFQQLVENLREVFFVREADSTRVLYVSPSVQKLWPGFDGDLEQVWPNFFARVFAEDREKLAMMQQNLSQPGGVADLEYRMHGPNGEVRWVWGRATHLGRAPEPDWIVGVIEDITDRKRLEQALSKMAKTDPLTGLANRAHFFEQGELERYRANRYGHPLAVLMIDIDYFKQVNDTYGHAVGDMVLVMVTRHCRQLLRSTDLMARIGGEEFAVLLSETDLEQAYALAERLRAETERQQVVFEGQNVFVTISIGVAQLQLDDSTFDAVLKRADNALYQAKKEGRNRAIIAGY